jgi:outer membrane protein
MKVFRLLALLSLIQLQFCFADVSEDAPPSPITLEQCLTLALDKNPTITRAREKVTAETGRTVQARAGFLPRVDLQGRYSKTDKGLIPDFNNTRFGTDRNWSTQIALTQTIFAGGKVESTYSRQRYTEEAALYQLAAIINNELSKVKQLFFASLLARDQLKVQEENIKLLSEELRLEKARFDAGAVSKFNVLRAEVALANAQTPLIKARNNTRTSLFELERSLGIYDEQGEAAAPDLAIKGTVTFEPVKYNFEEALAEAYAHRAELRSMDLMINASKEGIDIAWSEFLPTITGSVDYRAQNNQFSDSIRDNFHGWVAGGEVSWNVFNGFSTIGKIEEARANKRDALAQRNDARAMVRLEIKKALSSIEEANALLESSKKVVEQAKESLRLANARFEAGASSQIDILDSQVALTQARTNEVQALYDYENAKTELKRALGTDLTVQKIELEQPTPTASPTTP